VSTLTIALDGAGQLVSALTAPKKAKYVCLECNGSLHVKRGEQRAAHFAHDHEDPAGCAGESVTHLAAKHLLAAQLRTELTQDGRVRWMQHCPGVEAGQTCRMRSALPQGRDVPEGWEVREEVTHGRYRFDVAVVVQGAVVFGFEVYHRHAVPDEKAADLTVPWLELVAEDILEFKPRVPYRGSHSEQRCLDCQALLTAIRERQARDARREKQSAKYVTEVLQVQRTWESILHAAKVIDDQQRQKRARGH
jgi:ribosomal protein L34E